MLTVANRIAECGGPHTDVRDIDLIVWLIVHRFGWNDLAEYDKHGITPDAVGVAKFYKTNPEAIAATGGRMPYPFVIGRGGTIWQTAEVGVVTPHAARFNVPALGVACLGDFRFLPPTVEQKRSLVDLCAAIARFLRQIKIRGHDEVPGASRDPNKSCPGACLDMHWLRGAVESAIDNEAAHSLITAGVVL